jgi:hypothetical protein
MKQRIVLTIFKDKPGKEACKKQDHLEEVAGPCTGTDWAIYRK